MTNKLNARILILAIAGVAALALGGCGGDGGTDGESASGDVTISNPWARTTAPKQEMGAIYMSIESPDGDTLTQAKVPTSVAKTTELHETVPASEGDSKMEGSDHSMDSMSDDSGDGAMMMKQVSSISLPAGETVELKPGGYHVMLIGLKQPIAEGDEIEVTLTFAKAGQKTVTAVAKS